MRIQVWRGDITQAKADAVVDPANCSLYGGRGVDGAIRRVGGPAIAEACRELRETTLRDGLATGQAVATKAGDLPVDWVIHTAGPIYSRALDRSGTLASCYRECLRVADRLRVGSIAFPTISAGAFGWPVADATWIAVHAVHAVLASASKVERAVMVAFSDAAEAGYRSALDHVRQVHTAKLGSRPRPRPRNAGTRAGSRGAADFAGLLSEHVSYDSGLDQERPCEWVGAG
ncbi:MAG: O-acetyl-ADP-ribose deacetylase [Bifidobacteriaceae bacterium]|jgi:O-acetyl-ADP-ribose deacetylase (regulator of RNase III)|nr:O-acetyl-ADP-ribose deacetylase [Bifidobacteriaceae bacterium]